MVNKLAVPKVRCIHTKKKKRFPIITNIDSSGSPPGKYLTAEAVEKNGPNYII